MKKNLGTIPVARYVRRKLNDDESVPMCSDHGPQIYPAHRYCFKAIILEDTTSASLTCFTQETKGLPMHECEQLLQKVKSKVLEIPAELKALHGKKHVFQLHVSHGCKKGRAEFILNDVFDHEPFAILPGTSELSVAPANVAISEMSDPPRGSDAMCASSLCHQSA
ncbi:nucleic acid-binding, OB-fold protein [Tanacetum coccineum]